MERSSALHIWGMIPSGGGIANGGALLKRLIFTNAKCGLSVKVIALTP
jgi:hypothetical protein